MYPQITAAQLKTLLRSNKRFALIDALSETQYGREHIPAAVSLPEAAIEEKAGALFGKDDLLVVYGEGPRDDTAENAAARLASLGFKHVVSFPGGLEDYRDTGLPLEGRKHGLFPRERIPRWGRRVP